MKRAFDDIVRQRVRQRLEVALGDDDGEDAKAEPVLQPGRKRAVQTTDEEWRAFYIVQAIAAEITDPSNIAIRDAKAYCAILFADNNRRPICRLFLEGATKSIIFFDQEKREERIYVDGPDDIYRQKTRILDIVRHYSEVMEGT